MSDQTNGPYGVYLIRCADGTYYAGMAKDVEKRFEAHCNLQARCRYTRVSKRHPLKLAAAWAVSGGRSEAQQLEYRIKQLPASVKGTLEHCPERLLEIIQQKKWNLEFQIHIMKIYNT